MKVRDERELIWRDSADAEMDEERQGGGEGKSWKSSMRQVPANLLRLFRNVK